MSADGGFEFATVPSPEELARFPLNDLGNAWRLIRTVGGRILDDGTIDAKHARLLYLRNRGWIAFNGRHWDLAAGEEWARRFAHQVASGLIAQGRIVAEEQIASPSVWAKFVQGAGSSGASGAMLAQAQAYLSVDLKEFDNHPLWINCQNGVLKFDLKGEAASPRFTFQKVHEPADRITRICEAIYDPKAERPLFDKLAADAQPNAELRGFLQTVFGYAATGATNEQVFVILQGKGGDGKSTLVNAVRDVLGAYACSAGIEMFLDAGVRRGGEASPEVARLSGDTRLIATGEPPRGSKLATSAVKAFTGGGSVAARELRQSIFEFQPIGKVVLECNSRPAINDTDDGIWRRLLIILFEHQVPVASRDKDLPDKLKAEKSGILNWLVDGVLAWLAGGLVAPAAVRQAIEDYRLGGNPFGEWFADRLDRSDPSCRTRAGELYADYKAFCDENGHDRPMSTTAFGRALGDMQIILAGKDSSGKKLRRGAKLKPKYAPEELEDPFAPPGAGLGSRSSPGGVRGDDALEPPLESAFDADLGGDFGPERPDDDFGGR